MNVLNALTDLRYAIRQLRRYEDISRALGALDRANSELTAIDEIEQQKREFGTVDDVVEEDDQNQMS